MSKFLKHVFGLKKKELKKLERIYTEKTLTEAYFEEFKVGENLHTITGWWLNYYIDKHGNFTKKKSCHAAIARAILKGLTPDEQIEVYDYIQEQQEGFK